ncbi:5K protein [Beet black scorch virus]|uniref:5K protein n=1 Tax=Beet black scorch virus TaxID=196375 RepID=Q8B5R8_9TOMB|nr:5K protein [Beet black scorch virus]AAN76815.3 5K protein [Beet black scorch virus]AAT44840.1 5K protein [Beet black scorch virus]
MNRLPWRMGFLVSALISWTRTPRRRSASSSSLGHENLTTFHGTTA